MRKNTFMCMGWIPFLLCTLLLLAISLAFMWRSIEQDVKRNAESALQESTHSWAKIETYNRGRDVLITGNAPNQEAISDAIRLVSNAKGVRVAEHNGDPLAEVSLFPAELNAEFRNGRLALTGTLANQEEVDSVLTKARATFGSNRIDHSLRVNDRVGTVSNLSFIGDLKPSAKGPSSVKATLVGESLELSGNVSSRNDRSDIEAKIRRTFNGSLTNNLKVVLPPVKRDVCQELVNELLAKGKINFATESSEIDEASFTLLADIVITANRCPKAQFEVSGHTDNTGEFDFNMKLSQDRAQAVVDYLVRQGLPEQNFKAVGYGTKQPVASNSNDRGRAQNRRIEFRLSN